MLLWMQMAMVSCCVCGDEHGELVMLLPVQMMMLSSFVGSVRGDEDEDVRGDEHEDAKVLGTAGGGPRSWARQEEVRCWHSSR
jgi:hypothetical protein